jgi:replicative DNA helicase
MESKTPPQDLDAEQSVLGSILLDNEAYTLIDGILAADDFYKEGHRKIFRGLEGLYQRAEPMDLVTLSDALRRSGDLEAVGNVPYLIGLVDSTPTAAYVESYARIVREKRLLRDLISMSGSIMQSAFDQALPLDEIVEKAEQGVYALATTRTGDRFRHMRDLSAETARHLSELQAGVIEGISSGFTELDRMLTGGFKPGSLNILAARPSMGKTALSLAFAHSAAKGRRGGAFFSLEMSDVQLEQRLLAMEGRIDMQRLRNGQMHDRDWQRAADTLGVLSELDIFVDDSPELSIGEFRSRARRLASRSRLEWIIVDYLQLMRGPSGGNREQEISAISRGLKATARELDVPVIALSQLSRAVESRPNKRPMLSDLRESGSIEQDADLVMFIYRDEYYDPKSEQQGVAEVIIGKQRNGPVGTVELTYLASHTRFANKASAADLQAAHVYRGGN